jgi:hypothetical protein
VGRFVAIAVLVSIGVAGCGGPATSSQGAEDEGTPTPVASETPNVEPTPEPEPTPYGDNPGASVGDHVASSCATSVVRPLSEQLIAELNCLQPDVVSRIPNDNQLNVGNIFDYLQTDPAESLPGVANDRPGATMTFNSALRSLAQQFLLYEWYLAGRCGIPLAATPGTSNHERGLAIDIADSVGWRDELEGNNWNWLGPSDAVHYDFVGGGTVNISGTSVRAFQRLWNLNHPDDMIVEDGDYGPNTRTRLRNAPANGFIIGSSCGEPGMFAAHSFVFEDDRPETCGL